MTAALVTPAPEVATALEIVADRKEFLHALSSVIGVVERRTTIPILTNLLMETGEGAVVKLAATNLSQSVTATFTPTIRGEGSIAVPARKLYEYVKLLSGDQVSIRQEENNWIQIRSGRSKTKMVGMGSANFPTLPQPSGESITLESSLLQQFIRKSIVTTSDEESRYALRAALLVLHPTCAEMVSTEGHCLTLISKGVEDMPIVGRREILIPRAALIELKSLLTDEAIKQWPVVEIWESDSTLFFSTSGVLLSTQKISGQYPNYAAVIPRYDSPAFAIDVDTVSSMLNRCLLFSESDSRAVAFEVEKDQLRITSAAKDLGSTEETIDILGGPDGPLAIGFNGEYIKNLLGMISGNVEVQFESNQRAALFTWRNDEGYTLKYVAMPMRLGSKK